LNLPGGAGLKLGPPGLTAAGPAEENGVTACGGGAGGAARKDGGSDPTPEPVDEKGVTVRVGGKGGGEGLEGKVGRPGFSVPIGYYKTIQITSL